MPKDNSNNDIDNSGNLITFFFVNPLIDNSGSNVNLNITDNSMSLIPLDNTNNTDNNLDFSGLEEWRRRRIDFIINLLREGSDNNNSQKNTKRHRSSSTSDINMNNPRSKKKYRDSSDLVSSLDINVIKPVQPPIFNNRLKLNNYLSLVDRSCPYNNNIDSPKVNPQESPKVIVKEKVTISAEINCLDDLIELIKKYPIVDNVEYNINMKALHKIKPHLCELKSMIGMHSLKNHIVDQIIFYLQGFHKMGAGCDFMHTVIYGPPGTGKTEVAKIIGKIFSRLGVLPKNKFSKVTRADLIAGYLGQTAIKTRDVIKDALGGVLFIDEAYALGNPEKRDSFAKECIDTLCEGLSDHKDKLMVIIAGYEKELKTCFFAYNAGLDSRFTWRFKTDDYKPEELMEIFRKKIMDAGWSHDDKALNKEWFIENKDYFKYYGRDMETLFAKVKIVHSRRVFCLPEDQKTIVTMKDMIKGLELYLSNDEVKSRKEDKDTIASIHNFMYV